MKRRIVFIIIIGILFLSNGPIFSSDYKKKLDSINSQVTAINNRLNQLNQEKSSLLNEIYKIELKYEKELIEINKVKLQLKATQGKINRKEREKKELEQQIQQSKQKVKKIIRIVYKLGGNTYVRLFIQVDSFDQLFKNYRLFISLIQYKTDEINKIKENILRLNKIKSQLQEEYGALRNFKSVREQKLRNLSYHKRGKLNLIKKITHDKKDYMQLRDELKHEASRLNEVISGKKTKSSLRVINLKQIKGRLEWPVTGKVISSFGKKRSTRFDTYIINNGIEIKPSGSDKIKAVYSGDVVFADYYKGYGNLIIIQHSRNLHSLYGHCEKIFKKRGESIKTGDIIAAVGDTGSTVGKSLYFEIRNRLKSQDPLKWLRKR
jgi:septal ring factor EnvC (AmiA/AmiB activator)